MYRYFISKNLESKLKKTHMKNRKFYEVAIKKLRKL